MSAQMKPIGTTSEWLPDKSLQGCAYGGTALKNVAQVSLKQRFLTNIKNSYCMDCILA